jgi:hypothetical protein
MKRRIRLRLTSYNSYNKQKNVVKTGFWRGRRKIVWRSGLAQKYWENIKGQNDYNETPI